MNSFALWHEAADTLKEWFSHCLSNLPKAFVYILNHETSNIPKFPANEKEIATCVLLFWFLFLQDMMWILNSSRITGAGSKAKSMPCGHLFHDDCLISWVGEPNLEKKTCRGPDSSSCFFMFDIDVRLRIQVYQTWSYHLKRVDEDIWCDLYFASAIHTCGPNFHVQCMHR